MPCADFAGNCDKRLNRRPLLVAWPGERHDRGLRIANWDVGDVSVEADDQPLPDGGSSGSLWVRQRRRSSCRQAPTAAPRSPGSKSTVARDVDAKPAVRKRLVSAILLGGNVMVKRGSDVGGDFKHIPGCRSDRQLGCVVAFSTFDQPVPPMSLFGRTSSVGQAVLCTNPAALGGGRGLADLITPSKPFDPGSQLSAGIKLIGLTYPNASTTWISEPNAYRATCSSANNANVLEITPVHGAQTPKPSPTATWGLHLIDANIALGNLIAMVKSQAQAFVAHQIKH